ncbi:hypothetical protein [Shewanella acanthi]|uniref:hypothetical protein n=1 Tax=Shewanella acanthi TaxID=2864212 RepID=UPI001C65B543|nr:hypothetical protein [Shewanella acanthi]QYJ78611.1 hypothetical protein K0H61_16230 [Shewanella acanthi]
MKNFGAGFNNYWVGFISGIMLPIILVAALLYASVAKLTGLIDDSAIAPLIERSEQTFDKVDHLLVTLDDKVDNASLKDVDLKDLALLAPLKNAQLFPELQTLASGIANLKQAASDFDRETAINNLRETLQTSLAGKFPEDKAKELAQNLMNIAQVLAEEKLEPLQ